MKFVRGGKKVFFVEVDGRGTISFGRSVLARKKKSKGENSQEARSTKIDSSYEFAYRTAP